mgnify:CR=1 FL=1|tara:strand:- start:121 stop:357 length:237 start_codon:yes stop_codon:yes gene_type:complete
MSVQDGHPLVYRGISGFDSKEKCLEQSVKAENIMLEMEMKRGIGEEKTIWIESFCIPFDIFKPVVIKKDNKSNSNVES